MDKILRNALATGIVIVSLSVGYYLIIFLPRKEETRNKMQQAETEAKIKNDKEIAEKEETKRKNCYSEAVSKAQNILKTRTELYYKNDANAKKAVENDLYNKDDFDKFYDDCLSVNGLKK